MHAPAAPRAGKSAARRASAAAAASRQSTRAKRGAGTRPRKAQTASGSSALTAEVKDFLEAYNPHKAEVRQSWDDIKAPVKTAVATYAPASTARATQVISAVAGLAAHRHTQGHSMADGDWLTRDAIDEYVASLPATPHTRIIKTRLETVARATGALEENRPLVPLPRTPVATPYLPTDLATIRAHIGTRSTRDQLLAVMLLGLGAGLDGREIPDVTGNDIVVGDHCLLVRAAGVRPSGRSRGGPPIRPARPPRLVPITHAVEAELAQLAIQAGDAPLAGDVIAAKRDLASIQSRWPKTLPHIEGGRLRATWIARHLQRTVPVAALSAAGTGDADRTFAHLSTGVDATTYMKSLRGTACCPQCTGHTDGAAPFDPDAYPTLTRVPLAEVQASIEAVRP
jgi:hypothetical protein